MEPKQPMCKNDVEIFDEVLEMETTDVGEDE